MIKNNIFSFFLSKKVIIICFIFINLTTFMFSNNKTYPFIYVPGMFDKENQSKEEGINILHGLFKAIMNEFGLDLKYLLENENYSVIDYFAENPIKFWE